MNLSIRVRPPKHNRMPYFLAGAAGAAVVLLWIVSGAGMTIRSISVSGNRSLSAKEIIRIVSVASRAKVSRAEAGRVRARLMRHPAFLKVSVSRRIGGTLSVMVSERVPAAWLVSYNCPVSQDGVLLPYIGVRDPELMMLDGFAVDHGCLRDLRALREAKDAWRMTSDIADGAEGIWRRMESKPASWEWIIGKKRITFSSPVGEDEAERLRTFKTEFPDAWRKAGGLDLRFRDRVVMKR